MIDSHAHLSCFSNEEIEGILSRAKEQGIDLIINISTDFDELQTGLRLAEKNDWIYNVAAIPPHDVTKEEGHFDNIARIAREGKLVAVGECGLDYYYGKETKEKQITLFRRSIQLSKECHLPLVIHCRDAFGDFFRIADEERIGHDLLVHCFTGNEEEAQEVLKRGWLLSFSGIVTFKKSEKLREVAALVPLDRLLIETDAPFLAPEPYRGKRNEPAYLTETANTLASIRGLSLDDFLARVSHNTRQFFRI